MIIIITTIIIIIIVIIIIYYRTIIIIIIIKIIYLGKIYPLGRFQSPSEIRDRNIYIESDNKSLEIE